MTTNAMCERLLIETAVKTELSETRYAKAVERYEAVRTYIERDGSPLKGKVNLFYPQGSMAIGTTIDTKVEDSEYDIDVVAEVADDVGQTPSQTLDRLEEAVRGEPGSRYYEMVKRKNRCIRVNYAPDAGGVGMHLDITPAKLMPGWDIRTSKIFEDKKGEQQTLLSNPWGFAEWFNDIVNTTAKYSDAYQKRGQELFKAENAMDAAEAEEVPDQVPLHRKPLTVVGLMLIKRMRVVSYAERLAKMPPSVILSRLVTEVAGKGTTLTDEILNQAHHIRDRLLQAEARGELLSLSNPRCQKEDLTDRWPENHEDQRLFAADLLNTITAVKRLRDDIMTHRDRRLLLASLFGEAPAERVFTQIAKDDGLLAQKTGVGVGSKGLVILGAGAASVTPVVKAEAHTFFGVPRKK